MKKNERAGEKVREAQRLYVHNTYIQKKHVHHQLGVTKTGGLETKTRISPSNLSPMMYVDIYLKVLLISVCLEK